MCGIQEGYRCADFLLCCGERICVRCYVIQTLLRLKQITLHEVGKRDLLANRFGSCETVKS